MVHVKTTGKCFQYGQYGNKTLIKDDTVKSISFHEYLSYVWMLQRTKVIEFSPLKCPAKQNKQDQNNSWL